MRGQGYVGRVSYSPKSFVQGVKVKADWLFSGFFGIAVITGLFAVLCILSIFSAILIGVVFGCVCVVVLAFSVDVGVLIGGCLCGGFRIEDCLVGREFGDVGGIAVRGDLVLAATGECAGRIEQKFAALGYRNGFAYVAVSVFDGSALFRAFCGDLTCFDGCATEARVAVDFVHMAQAASIQAIGEECGEEDSQHDRNECDDQNAPVF